MNEQPEQHQGSDDGTAPGPFPGAPTPLDPTPTVDWTMAADQSSTEQHPLTQPVPHVLPPVQAPYPGQPPSGASPGTCRLRILVDGEPDREVAIRRQRGHLRLMATTQFPRRRRPRPGTTRGR